MIKVYISSPYTLGDVGENVKRQMHVANKLMDLGFAPFIPLLFHFQHISYPRSYDEWLKIDLEWVKSCDCILRLKGESKGADIEVNEARNQDKPVFYSVDEIVEYYNVLKFNQFG